MAEPLAFNPLDPAFRRDPYAIYERGRREHPVLLHEGLPLRLASVFRYEDCQAILRDAETWSSEFQALQATEELPPPSMLGTDPPAHTRLRSLVNKAFTPRIVSRLEPRMRALAAELLDDAVAAGEVDLVQALSYPLPVVVIAEIIGIPAADRALFKRWSDEAIASLGVVFFGALDTERVERQRRLFDEMRGYFVPLAEERRARPQEDLLTGLVLAEHEGSKLSYDEMLSMLVLLRSRWHATGSEATPRRVLT